MEKVIEKAEKKEESGILKAAWLIALVTILSKAVGFIRDIITAKYYGTTWQSDAYFYAYQIPSFAIILLGGVGGPLHSATVAVFSKLIPDLNEKPPEFVNKLYNTFLAASVLFFTALGVLFFIFAPQVMQIIISNGTPSLVALAAEHLRIMTPVFVVGGIVGIYYGLLITYKKFILPNFSPIVMSLVIIASVCAIGLFRNDTNCIVLAWATTLGAICQFLLQFPQIKKIGFRFKPNFCFWNNPELKTLIELVFPAILSSTIGQLHIYIDMFFTSSLKSGAWTSVGYANRIFQFPVGILVTAFLVPLFPLFTRLVAKKDADGIRSYFNKGVGLLFYVAIPIIIGIVVVGMDCVRLVFERGEFDYTSSVMVFEALLYLSVSILPYVFRDSITRVYYAFDDARTPFMVAASSIILKILLNYLFITVMGMQIGGITLSTSLVTLYNAIGLGILMNQKIRLDYKDLFVNLAKMILIGAMSFVLCYFSAKFLSTFETSMKLELFEIIRILFVSVVLVFSYITMSLVFKIGYVDEVKDRILAKIIKR
ncbi:MAG: murein biosynthesis integral membrane protein MurJ [Candidatus Gastranaerophilales bacterium]|nr:murein biosynthesis integral membrane protein MurJ [Candidatus Gastranaerophilales bacterium]